MASIKTGRDIAAERVRCGMKQRELAERLGISHVLLSFLEGHPTVIAPTKDLVERVERVLSEAAA